VVRTNQHVQRTSPTPKVPELWKSTTEYHPKVPSSWGKFLGWKRGLCVLEQRWN